MSFYILDVVVQKQKDVTMYILCAHIYTHLQLNKYNKQVIFYTFQLLFNCIGFCVLCYAFLSAVSHIYSKQAQIQVGVTN